jgi:hypothetical protein
VVSKELYNLETFDTAKEAIDTQQSEEDLFGTRYFPVLSFPVKSLEIGRELAGGFKNCSEPLLYKDKVFFGVRAKTREISYIEDIYEAGGVVLKNRQWDW